jgi:hypothetical protein
MDVELRKRHIQSAPASGGKTALLKHFNGERLTRAQAIKAKCCDCMGYNTDGRMDCRMPHCSLYPFRPYKDDPRPKPKQAVLDRRILPVNKTGDTSPRKRTRTRQVAFPPV